jgi:hypothetical protein
LLHRSTNPKRKRGFFVFDAPVHGKLSMADRSAIPLPEPLAYFLTWPTYGTWLPGDERGWVQYRRGCQLPDPVKKLEATARMADDACRLNDDERRVVETTIAAHCRIRNWTLHAVNCRSNHLHIVVTASEHPDEVRDQFKSWCTHRLKEFRQQRLPTGSQQSAPVRRLVGRARQQTIY